MAGAGYKTNSLLKAFPSAANGVSVIPSGIANGFSAWVEMSSSFASSARLASIIVLPGFRAAGNYFSIQIGTGSAGNEVAVAEIRGLSGNNAGGPADANDGINLAIPSDVINIGDRVSVRFKQNSTDVTAWRMSFEYWELPIQPIGQSNMSYASVGPKFYPTSATYTEVTAGSGTYGAWVEFSSSTPADWLIGHIMWGGSNFTHCSLQIGFGSLGNEVVKYTYNTEFAWFINADAWQGGPYCNRLNPTLFVPRGTRVCVRIRKDSSGGTSNQVALGVWESDGVNNNNIGTSLPLKWAPAAGTYFNEIIGVSGTGSAPEPGNANFSPWVEFIASTSTKIAICNLVHTVQNSGGATWIQIGKGSLGNEVVIQNLLCGYGIWGGGHFNTPLPYATVVGIGERISIRIAYQSTTNGIARYFGIGYIEISGATPDFTNWTDDLVQAFYPQTTTVSTGSAAWQNGGWVEIDSSAPISRVLTGWGAFSNPAQVEVEFDVGLGSLGNEEVVTTFRYASGCDGSGGSVYNEIFGIPLIIPVGERLSVRARCSLALPQQVAMALHYTTEPPNPIEPVTLSGLYYLLTPTDVNAAQRRHDTLYTDYDPVTTENVAIPNPRAVLGYIGDE